MYSLFRWGFPIHSDTIRLLIMASQLDYILSEAEQLWSRSKLPILAPSVPLILSVLLLGLLLYPSKGPTLSSFPLINPKSSLDVLGVAAKRDYAINGGQIIEAGFKQVGTESDLVFSHTAEY